MGALRLFRHQPDFPVFYTEANALAPFLEARGILVSSFTYPTPADVTQVAADCQKFAAALWVYSPMM